MFPVLYQPCTTNLEPPEPLMASYVRFMAFWGCFWPFWGSLMAIWDLHAKLGLFWDQIWTLVPFGTKSQIWDFIRRPAMQTHIITASPESLWSRWAYPYWSSSNSTGRLTADWTQMELKRGKETWHLVKMMLSMGRAILVSHCPCSSQSTHHHVCILESRRT